MGETTERTQTIYGSCLCGTIKYHITGDPALKILCYCQNCRKSTGSLGMANSIYRRENVTITQGHDTLRTYKDNATNNGSTVERSFCGNCGSNLFCENKEKGPELVIVTSGTMDLAAEQTWEPVMEFYCKDKKTWLDTNVETRKFEEVPTAFDNL
ncbi:Mss4-like protein [Aspergillus caelatus]|uniref:Mss4-like protein n=1 Tax=Aspergillus caelatus TaxID=61420 RepID=A0A5N7AHI9_9EURO|nr:Mss4-like protein [Aspergillus caelatus]KAE8369332.1 Mss4-like protein [Aspergillus caelatus]